MNSVPDVTVQRDNRTHKVADDPEISSLTMENSMRDYVEIGIHLACFSILRVLGAEAMRTSDAGLVDTMPRKDPSRSVKKGASMITESSS